MRSKRGKWSQLEKNLNKWSSRAEEALWGWESQALREQGQPRNGQCQGQYELAQGTKQAILKKVEEIFKIDSEKKAADLTVKDLGNNKFLKLSKMIDSVKIDVLGKDPKHDSNLGFKTIPLCLNFAAKYGGQKQV